MYLVARTLITEKIEDNFWRNREPEGGSRVENDARRAARIVDTLPRHHPHIFCSTARQRGPLVSGGGAHTVTEAYHHPLGELQHALPPFSCLHDCASIRNPNQNEFSIERRPLILKARNCLPPPSPAGMLLAITLASRSHCRSKVETQRFAPNARPELTKGLYML